MSKKLTGSRCDKGRRRRGPEDGAHWCPPRQETGDAFGLLTAFRGNAARLPGALSPASHMPNLGTPELQENRATLSETITCGVHVPTAPAPCCGQSPSTGPEPRWGRGGCTHGKSVPTPVPPHTQVWAPRKQTPGLRWPPAGPQVPLGHPPSSPQLPLSQGSPLQWVPC